MDTQVPTEVQGDEERLEKTQFGPTNENDIKAVKTLV